MALSVTGCLKENVGFCMSVSVFPLYISLWVFLCDCECLGQPGPIHRMASPCTPLSPSPQEPQGKGSGSGKELWGMRCRWSRNGVAWLGGQHQGAGVGVGSHRRERKGDRGGSLLPALCLLARAYLHGIYISFASRSIKNLTSSRLPGAACPAW